MSRKTRLQIPKFAAANMYTYFEDLNTPTAYPIIDMIKQKLYLDAAAHYGTGLLNDIAVSNDQASDTIISAIDFLGQMAAQERTKELKILEVNMQKLKQQIPPQLLQSHNNNVNQLLRDLQNLSTKFTNGSYSNIENDIRQFYIELTTCINVIRENIEDFRARVQQISDNTMTKYEQLSARSTEYRIEDDLNILFQNIIGVHQNKVKDLFATRVPALIGKFLTQKNILSNIDIRQHFPAIAGGMMADFEFFLQHQRNATSPSSKHLTDYSAKELTSAFEDYIKQSSTLYLQRLNRLLKNEESSRFLDALNRFEKGMGFSYLKGIQAKDRLQDIAYQDSQSKRADPRVRNYIHKRLNKLNDTLLMHQYELLTWNPPTDLSHGTVYEIIQDLLFDHLRVGGIGATDNITLGTLKATIDPGAIDPIINSYLQDMAYEINNMTFSQRTSRLDDKREAIIRANDSLHEIQMDLADQLHQLNALPKEEDLFVYHESLKLYSSIEITKDNKRQSYKFHGREMLAFNVLDNLYTLEDLGVVKLANKEDLYGLVLNVAEGAIGHSALPAVENYLSIFAGLLLFSDIRDMAVELAHSVVQNIETDSIQKIHLYLLNSTYVPASMVLTYVYESIRNAYSHISLKNGARVTIDTSAAAHTIATYIKDRSKGKPYARSHWDMIANKIMSGTKMQINFLSGYVTFIKDIARAI